MLFLTMHAYLHCTADGSSFFTIPGIDEFGDPQVLRQKCPALGLKVVSAWTSFRQAEACEDPQELADGRNSGLGAVPMWRVFAVVKDDS